MTSTTKNKPAKSETSKPEARDPEIGKQIAVVRDRVHQTFGQIALAMMVLPRYRHLNISDLNRHLLDPLLRDKVALATRPPAEGEDAAEQKFGVAIWASVSEEVDAKIQEQIREGVFPVRLNPGDWASGEINWLLDVIAPDQRMATSVIANLKKVVKQGDVKIHPLVARMADAELLKKLGAEPVKKS